MKKHIYFLFLILLLTSCGQNNNENRTLSNIENLVKTDPDSALVLCDSVKLVPNDLYNQNKYFLYRIQAKDLASKDISMDKEILDVYNYFNENENIALTGLAAFYSGRVFQENRDYDSSVLYYNIAENMAVKSGDKDFQGIIQYSMGRLMLRHLMIDEARKRLTEADLLFAQTENHKYKMKTYNVMGSYYLIADKADSALLCYDKGLDLALKYNDRDEQIKLIQNIGLVYSEAGEYQKAICNLKGALKYANIAREPEKLYLNLAYTYFAMNKLDSASYFANETLNTINKKTNYSSNLKPSVFQLLSQIEEKSHNLLQALELHKIYSENLAEILTENKHEAIINAESKYKYEIVQKENALLTLKQVKTQLFLIIALFIIAASAMIYYNLLLRKNKQLLRANDEIVNLTDDILSLTEIVKDYNSTKESYKDNLIHNFNILKRAASLEFYVTDSGNKQGKTLIKRFNEIAYGNDAINWVVLYNTINSINNGIFDRIGDKYPDLDETEFRICCLIYCKFHSNEIAIITQLSTNTIHMKTTSIRKKLGIEKYGNIIDFFNNNDKI